MTDTRHESPAAATATPVEPLGPAHWIDPYDPANRREWVKLFLLLLITIAAYVPALLADFSWQDDVNLSGNAAARSVRSLSWGWSHPRARPVYRPLFDTFALPQQKLWGAWNPTGYHVVSVLLHLGCTALAWMALRRLYAAGALLAAGLFALHPVAVHAVAWVSGQSLLLSSFLCLLATLPYLRFTELDAPPEEFHTAFHLPARKWMLFVLIALLFGCAMLCNTATWTWPAAMLLVTWWKRPLTRRDARMAAALLVMGAAAAAFVEWAARSQSPLTAGWAVMPIARVLFAAALIVFHLLKLIVPYPLLFVYRQWDAASPPWWHVLILAAVVGGLVVLWRKRERLGRGVFTAAGIYVVLILPAALSADLRHDEVLIGDQQQYLARLAPLALLGAAIAGFLERLPTHVEVSEDGEERVRTPFTKPLLLALSVIGLGGLTARQSVEYMNEIATWRAVIAHNPDSRLAHVRLGMLLAEKENLDDASSHFQTLIDKNPSDAEALMKLGELRQRQNRPDDAIRQYQHAAMVRPADGTAYRHIAAAYAQRGDAASAIAYYKRAIALDANDDQAHNNLATLLANQGKTAEAIEQFDAALRANPQSVATHLNLAKLMFLTGNYNDAADHLQRAVQIDPNNFEAYMTAGMMLMDFKEFNKASRMFQQAVRIKRDSPQALNGLGVTLMAQGRSGEAIYAFGRALDLDPKNEAVRRNLELAQSQRKTSASLPTTSPR